MIRCAYSQPGRPHEVDPADPSTHQRIVAWEKKALPSSSRKGGADARLREHLNEFACGVCIEKLRSGLDPGQEGLL